MIKAWRLRRAFFICGHFVRPVFSGLQRVGSAENPGAENPGESAEDSTEDSTEGTPGELACATSAYATRYAHQPPALRHGHACVLRHGTITGTTANTHSGSPHSRLNPAMGAMATDSAGLRFSHENPVCTAVAAESRGENRAIRNGCAHAPAQAGTNPPTTNPKDKSCRRQIRSSKIWKSWQICQHACGSRHYPALFSAAIDIAAIDIKNLNLQASATGASRLRSPSG
ncbi:hypothetical protein [Achromobacter ruhlandii]|uniref:hypothetical protein n=1 Tax=Achromobacter ruhlandii TaxID=72557 RepID=UPI0012FDBA12|nr:hypothetical protein [Achromobacter ruhlandii]